MLVVSFFPCQGSMRSVVFKEGVRHWRRSVTM